jgi:hypothetical protein
VGSVENCEVFIMVYLNVQISKIVLSRERKGREGKPSMVTYTSVYHLI